MPSAGGNFPSDCSAKLLCGHGTFASFARLCSRQCHHTRGKCRLAKRRVWLQELRYLVQQFMDLAVLSRQLDQGDIVLHALPEIRGSNPRVAGKTKSFWATPQGVSMVG